MAVSPLLEIPLLSASQVGKESTINTAIAMLERSMNDAKTISFAGGNVTLPSVDLSRYFYFKITGAALNATLTIPAMKRMFVVDNLANGNPLKIICGTANLVIPSGGIVIVYCDGSSLVSVADSTIMGNTGGVTSFLELNDAPHSYNELGGFFIRVKTDLTGLEAVKVTVRSLADVSAADITEGQVLVWSAAQSKFVAATLSTGGAGNSSWLEPVAVATTVAGVLATDFAAGKIIDQIPLSAGMRILIKNQADAKENGIYVVDATAAPIRSSDQPAGSNIHEGQAVAISGGRLNGRKVFLQTTPIGVVGAQNQVYAEQRMTIVLSDLQDVDLTTVPTAGQILVYDDISKTFKPKSVPGVGDIKMSSLSDVDVATNAPAEGQALAYDGVTKKWVPRTITGGGGSNLPPLTGNAGRFLGVKMDESGTEWRDPPEGGGGTKPGYKYIRINITAVQAPPATGNFPSYAGLKVFDAMGVRLIPVAVKASSEYAGRVAINVLDDDVNTVWTNNGTTEQGSVWIELQFATAVVPAKIVASSRIGYGAQFPTKGFFSGSNDGSFYDGFNIFNVTQTIPDTSVDVDMSIDTVSPFIGKVLPVSTQTASYTLKLVDIASYVRVNVAAQVTATVTVPASGAAPFPIGSVIQVRQVGQGSVTLAVEPGVTLNTSETLKLRKKGSTVSLIKVGPEEWDVTGDLERLP